MLKYYKKKVAVFMIWIIIFSFFNLLAIAPSKVSAEVPYCCVQTVADDSGNREYCLISEDSSSFGGLQCDGTPVYGSDCVDANAPSDCSLETCIPVLGDACLSNYPKVKCLNEGGVSNLADKESIPECGFGCCDLGGSCTIVEQNECLGSHDSSITNQVSCSLSCSPSQIGCCETTGSCGFTNLGSCNINDPSVIFHQDNTCTEVTSCAARAESHKYLGCGDGSLEQGSEHTVYWYDSEGNREEIPSSGVDYIGPFGNVLSTGNGNCGYPDHTCEDPDGLGVGEGAYCKSTACLLEGDCPDCTPSEFLHGETICLSPWGGHFSNDMRSKEIKGFVLECNSGDIVEPTDVYSRSDFVCIDDEKTFNGITRKTARKISNEYESCLSCGDDGWKILDVISYVPGFGGLIQGALGSLGGGELVCRSESLGWDWMGVGWTGEICEDISKTSDGEMCKYDHDFYAPIGSCNPVNPPEGDRCDLCGKGGDGYTNICTMEECNVLGDCGFEPEVVNMESAIAAGALSMGTAYATYTMYYAGCKLLQVTGIYGCDMPISWTAPAELWYGSDKVITTTLFGLDVTYTAIYWMLFGIVVGGVGESTNVEEEFESVLANEDGSINLARALSVSNTISKEVGTDSKWVLGYFLSNIASGSLSPSFIGELILKAKLQRIYAATIEENINVFIGNPCISDCADGLAWQIVDNADKEGIIITFGEAKKGVDKLATFQGVAGVPGTQFIPGIPAIGSYVGVLPDGSNFVFTGFSDGISFIDTGDGVGNFVDSGGGIIATNVPESTLTWTETIPAGPGTPAVPATLNLAPTEDVIINAVDTAADATTEAAGEAVKLELGKGIRYALKTIGAIIHVVSTANSLKPGKCSAETPYSGNENCGQCGGAEGQWYCSQERCDVLGGSNNQCKYLQGEGFEDSKCVPLDPTDPNPPGIEKISVQLFDSEGNYFETKEVNSNKLDISTLYEWKDLNSIFLEIETNEDAKCKYSKESNSEFDIMSSLDLVGGSYYALEHNTNITFSEFDKTGGDIIIYLKCEDINGNVHTAGDDHNTVKFHFDERPDELPPEVTVKSPSTGAFLPETTSTINWVLNVHDNNAVAGCKYTQKNSTLYADMDHLFTYKGETTCVGTSYACQEYEANLVLSEYESTNITELLDYGAGSLTYNFEFSCIDGSGNDNNPVLAYGFNIVPGFDVNITSPESGSDIYDINPQIIVETSAVTSCDYTMDGTEYEFDYGDNLMSNTHSAIYSGNLTGSPEGVSHELVVNCKDLAYNEASSQINFSVIQDLVLPNLLRLYTYNGKLWIVLDEESTCSFTTPGNDEPIEMLNIYGNYKYFTDLIGGVEVYYITCADVWDNEASFTIYP